MCVYKTFTRTTLEGQTKNRKMTVQPLAPKNGCEVAGRVESWEKRFMKLLEEEERGRVTRDTKCQH